MMNTFEVIVSKVSIQFPLHLGNTGKESSPERHSPELSEDRSLQPFNKPVGPGMPGFGSGMADLPGSALPVELSKVLSAAVGQDPLNIKSLFTESRDHSLSKERRRLCGTPVANDQPGHTEGGRCVTGGVLPDLAHALELADIEGVDAHQFPWDRGLNMARFVPLSPKKLSPGSLCQQPGGLGRMLLKDHQTLEPGLQPVSPEDPIDRTLMNNKTHLTTELRGQPQRTPGRLGDRPGKDSALYVRRRLMRVPEGSPSTRAKTVRAFPFKPLLPPVETGPADPQLTTRLADIADPGRIKYGMKPKLVYTIDEGHNFASFLSRQQKG